MIKLFCGDCLDIMPTLESGSVDMVLCDLPYGTTAFAWDAVVPFPALWSAYSRLCAGAVVLTGNQPFSAQLVVSNPREFKYALVWEKTHTSNPMVAKHRPLPTHEDVLVFRRPVVYNPQMTLGEPYKTRKTGGGRIGSENKVNKGELPIRTREGVRFPRSVFKITNPAASRGLHPTQKPVALMEYLIRTYTNPGDVVLDNCMGSGTTGVACVNTGRSFIGIEKDPAYFAIAESRINGTLTETRKGDSDVDTRSA